MALRAAFFPSVTSSLKDLRPNALPPMIIELSKDHEGAYVLSIAIDCFTIFSARMVA